MTRIAVGKKESRESFWRGQISLCESSGKSIVQYCRDAGLSASSYHRWKRELNRRGMARVQPPPPPPFAEIRLAPQNHCAAPSIEIALGGERRIRVEPGFDAQTLAEVVRVLESVAC